MQRVLGRARAREGDAAGAAEAFDRSVRILRGIGHLRAAREAGRQAAADGIVVAAADGPAVTIPAKLPAARPELLLQRAAALLEQAPRPDILGAEAIGVLAAANAVRAAAVVSNDTSGARRIELLHRWTHAQADAALSDEAMLTAPLGTWRERDWTLVADVSAGLGPRSGMARGPHARDLGGGAGRRAARRARARCVVAD